MRLDVFLLADLKSTHPGWRVRVMTLREVAFSRCITRAKVSAMARDRHA